MGLFRKKADPITDRSRQLTAEISALETQIQKLNSHLETRHASSLRVRSTAVPQSRAAAGGPFSGTADPIFEPVDQNRIKQPAESGNGHAMYNEHGTRKFDLPGLFRRVRSAFAPAAPKSNPQLVNYLAAGSIQGLRPLRYEKRVARNRFILLSIVLLLVLSWIIAVLL